MSEWRKVKLENLGEFYKGSGISRDEADSGELPAVRYGELYTNYDAFIFGDTCSKISQEVADNAFELRYGDIVFAGSGETIEDIGKSAVYLGESGYAGGDLIILRPDIEKVDVKFLALYFETELWKIQRRRSAQGQSVVHIHACDLKKMTINLPSLETQQKIVHILEECDAFIKVLKQKNEYEERKFQWLLSRLICGNANHKTEKLGNLAKIMTGKKDVNQGCPDGKYPFFTCAQKHTWSNDYSFDGEAICIAGNGEIGHSAYYSGKFEAYQRTYVLMDFKIPGKYVYYVISNLFKSMVEHQKQMSAMPYIKLKTLQEFEVPVFDNATMEKIVEIIDTQSEYILHNQLYVANLINMKNSLLNHLIFGDFDLNNIKLEKEESK